MLSVVEKNLLFVVNITKKKLIYGYWIDIIELNTTGKQQADMAVGDGAIETEVMFHVMEP